MKIKPASEEYLLKAKQLTEEGSESLLSRIHINQHASNKLSTLEALAIQLELDDEALSEWRENMHAIRDREAKEAKGKIQNTL